MKKGYSLIEILVVISIFAILAIVTTQTLLVSLSSTRKSEASIRVRENLEYAVSVMERKIRNANDVSSATTNKINYIDENDDPAFFECVSPGSTKGYIQDETGRLTSDLVTVTACNFTLTPGSDGVTDRVDISLSAEALNLSSSEKTPVNVSTTIYLRIY
jgi:prepilin-type N-terminal cleavage/methylation domain-containing protein